MDARRGARADFEEVCGEPERDLGRHTAGPVRPDPAKALAMRLPARPASGRALAARNLPGYCPASQTNRGGHSLLGRVWFSCRCGARQDLGHKGQTPVVLRPGQRQGISAASAVNAKSAFWFATYQGGLTGELFVALLKKMMRGRKKPIHPVVDGLPRA